MKRLMLAALVLGACSNSDDADLPLLPQSETVVRGIVEYRASTAVMESFPVQLSTEVRLTNQKGAPITVTFPDGCVVMVRVYRDANRRDLAWDMSRNMGCTMAIVPVAIGAGESRTVAAPTISAAEILGDSLPNGRYYFTAVVRPGGATLALPAGSVDLAR